MSRNVVGLLAAVGAAMSVLAALAHNDVALAILAAAVGAATGSAARLALLPEKKVQHGHALCNVETTV